MSETCRIDFSPTDPDETGFDPGPGKHVLYFGDPMCSWCWGFAPEMARLCEVIEDRAQLHLIMGGLRPGTRDPWDPQMRDYIRHHWQDVEAKTGQPFDYTRFDDQSFVYDTEPACRALVTVREHDATRALAMYEALQRAFYAEGLDVTDADVLAHIAEDQGIAGPTFHALFARAEARQQVTFDFNRTRSFGVTGFPSMLCAEDGQYAVLTLGYRPYTALSPMLEEWLNA